MVTEIVSLIPLTLKPVTIGQAAPVQFDNDVDFDGLSEAIYLKNSRDVKDVVSHH